MKTVVWKNTGGLLHRMFLNGGMTTVSLWLNSITLSQGQGYRQDAVSSSGCPTCRHTYPLAPHRWQDVWSAGQCLSEVSTVWSLFFPWQLKLILERPRRIWKYRSPPHTLPARLTEHRPRIHAWKSRFLIFIACDGCKQRPLNAHFFPDSVSTPCLPFPSSIYSP